MLIPIHLINYANKINEPKTVSNSLVHKKWKTDKTFFNDYAMMEQFREVMQDYIHEFSNTDNPYEKFYYNLMYRFSSRKADDKNIMNMYIDHLGYKKYLYDELLKKYQGILVGPLQWEKMWGNIYETIARDYTNEFKNELDEVTEKYKNNHPQIKSISEISKEEFEENILNKINLHNIFDYTLFKLFQSEEWKKIDPKREEKIKDLSQKNQVVFKEIMQMIKFRTTQNNNKDWKLYQLIVINHGKYGYFDKSIIDSIKATWTRQHKIGDFTKKRTLPQEWTKEKTKQQEALKSLPKINDLGFKPSAGIKAPKPVKDISNSKLKKYQIENMRDLINKYNQDQEKQKKCSHPLPTKPEWTLPLPTKSEWTLPLPTKPEWTLPLPTKPEWTLPLPTKPEWTLPLPTKPEWTLPLPTKPKRVLPLPTKPEWTLPLPTKPEWTLPLPTKPEWTLPLPTKPEWALPLPTKPEWTLPLPTKPEWTLPLPTKPEWTLPLPTKPERVLPLPKPVKEKVINPTDKVTKVIKSKHPWYKNNKIFYIIGGIGGFFALLCSFIVWKKRIK